MSKILAKIILWSVFLNLSVVTGFSAVLIDSGNGKSADADDYFKKRANAVEVKRRRVSQGVGSHYLALHFGGFVNSKSYNWGGENKEGAGKFSTGLTYRVGEWTDSTDFSMRIDFNSYDVSEGHATKMSIMPMISFPDANSGFPLYFGLAGGLGVYFKQVPGESALSLDYQLFAGGRFFNVFDTVGLTFETGLKNHVHLLSDGQYNAVYLNAGTIFVF